MGSGVVSDRSRLRTSRTRLFQSFEHNLAKGALWRGSAFHPFVKRGHELMQQNQVVIGPIKTRLGRIPEYAVGDPFHFLCQLIVKRKSGLSAWRGQDVFPIWQTDPRPEHAAGGRAINQAAFDLPCPAGGGLAELKQALAYDNKLVSHFYNFGNRGFLL